MRETVKVALGERSYEIVIARDIISGIGQRIRPFGFSPRMAVISNPTVFALYGEALVSSLKSAGLEPFAVLIPDGEEYKDYFWTFHILTEVLRQRLDRNSCLIALGGGVIGDIAGFAASIYMRGISFIQVPTTLLAQVDSSVGGKTGVNHSLGKNMIGTFYQPRLVWADSDTLRTLPARHLSAGIAEVIKYGVIWDEELFHFMEEEKDAVQQLNPEALERIIRRSCEIKAEIVSKDERESGLRALLNYGHTVGHAVETETGYSRFFHGEAVAIGMYLEARLALSMGYLDINAVLRIKAVLEAYDLPSELPGELSIDKLIAHMKLDKKAVADEINIVLPERIGKAALYRAIDLGDIRKLLSA